MSKEETTKAGISELIEGSSSDHDDEGDKSQSPKKGHSAENMANKKPKASKNQCGYSI